MVQQQHWEKLSPLLRFRALRTVLGKIIGMVLLCHSSECGCFVYTTCVCFGKFPRHFLFGCKEKQIGVATVSRSAPMLLMLPGSTLPRLLNLRNDEIVARYRPPNSLRPCLARCPSPLPLRTAPQAPTGSIPGAAAQNPPDAESRGWKLGCELGLSP